jgi:hypothetical protein
VDKASALRAGSDIPKIRNRPVVGTFSVVEAFKT